MVKDLSVRDLVPPMGMEDSVQAIKVKPVEFLDMPAVHDPCLTGIHKGSENNNFVHFELCLCREALTFPDIFA